MSISSSSFDRNEQQIRKVPRLGKSLLGLDVATLSGVSLILRAVREAQVKRMTQFFPILAFDLKKIPQHKATGLSEEGTHLRQESGSKPKYD